MFNEPFGYRSRSDSRRFNELQLQTVTEIHNLFERCRGVENALEEALVVLGVEHAYLGVRVADLRAHADSVTYLGNSRWRQFVPAADLVAEPGVIHATYGVATPEVSAPPISKLTLEQGGRSILPASCRVSVDPPADGFVVTDYGLTGALLGDNSAWRRTANRPISEAHVPVTATYTVELPITIIDNQNLNLITLTPWPCYSVDVLEISYRHQGAWRLVPGFVPANEAGPIFLPLPLLAATALRVTLRQRHGLNEGRYVSHLGIHHLGAYHASFSGDTARFAATAELRGPGPWTIESVEPRFVNAQGLVVSGQPYVIDLTARHPEGGETLLGSSLPVATSLPILDAQIAFTHSGVGAAPALEGVWVDYLSHD